MELTIYQIDAFTNQVFKGNPAAVCPLEDWLPDETLLNIAIENNLAETAFFVRQDSGVYHLRWFTPEIEMDLCGHATLASAYVIFEFLGHAEDTIRFDSQSGRLEVKKDGNILEMDLPSRPPQQAELPRIISNALSIQPAEVWKARDYMLVYDSEDDIHNLKVSASVLEAINIDPGGIIVTAEGVEADFVSRFFTPGAAVFEDPVTGSAHCTLTPFWAERLGKQTLQAFQVSPRLGVLECTLQGDRVLLRGQAVRYLEGKIYVS